MSVSAASTDSQAIALLCSTLALPRGAQAKTLGAKEWDSLRKAIHDSTFGRPGELVGRSGDELVETLQIPRELARRIEELLSRGGQLALELDRLAHRGIWMITRADEEYPAQLRRRLGAQAPPVLFGVGPARLLSAGGVAAVGSRDVSAGGLEFAAKLGWRCASEGVPVISGAARGVDITAMLAATEAGGTAVGVLADSLERFAAKRDLREQIVEENLTLFTSYHPTARFNVGNAMRRNRLIYCLADVAVVVASTLEKGGTRAGALENLQAGWVRVYVHDDGSTGNRDLIERGAHGLLADAFSDDDFPLDSSPLISTDPRLTIDDDGRASSADGPKGDDHRSVPGPDHAETASGPIPETHVREPGKDVRGAEDVFNLVWPRIAAFLSDQRSERDVAERFGLELAQARAWLKHAVDIGAAKRIENKRRYLAADAARSQSSLFTEN
jgi:predicted Rossmann fold nucleotide-binding protein DprA/Smf involved in DNA uptake